MTAKERLKEHRRLLEEAEDIEENIKRLRLRSMVACSGGTASGSNKQEDKMAANMIRMESLIDTYNRKLEQLLQSQAEVERMIETLPTVERLIIRYYYIDGMKWDAVARKVVYNRRYTLKLHGRALELLDKQKEDTKGHYKP